MGGRRRRRDTCLVSDTTQVPVRSQKRDTTLVSRGWLRCWMSDAIDTTVVSTLTSRLTPRLTPRLTSFGRHLDVQAKSTLRADGAVLLAALYRVFHRYKADRLSWAL